MKVQRTPIFSSDFSALITLFPSPLRQYGCRFLSAWERQSNCNRHLKSPAGHVTPHPQTCHSQAESACGVAAGQRANMAMPPDTHPPGRSVAWMQGTHRAQRATHPTERAQRAFSSHLPIRHSPSPTLKIEN